MAADADDDFEVNIDWGDRSSSLPPTGPSRSTMAPSQTASMEALLPTQPESANPIPAKSAPAWRSPAPSPAPEVAPASPAPTDRIATGMPVDRHVDLETVQASLDTANRRLEDLFTEAEKLRELTADRLTQFGVEVAGVSSTADELRAGLLPVAAVPTDVAKVLAAVEELNDRVDALATTQADIEARMTAGIESLQSPIESRIQRTTADAVTRLLAAINDVEPPSVDGLREQLEEMTNELRLVKRRLALRAKAPPAVLADEQVDHIIRSVTAAVVGATATGAPDVRTGPARPAAGEASKPRRRPKA